MTKSLSNSSNQSFEEIEKEDADLWKIADKFRLWVCTELGNLKFEERVNLRGDYVFIIDEFPRFIVIVDGKGAWSVALYYDPSFKFIVDEHCPLEITKQSIQNCLDFSARTTVKTDSHTLHKLLTGKLKAKVAFLTSKVMLNGDLPAFLKMVSILKRHGVGPLNETKMK